MTAGILVLEGADASGKTTLARYLREKHGARYLHCGPAADVWKLHLGAYLRATKLANHGHLVVVDRHWVSECIYGQVYRRGSEYPVAARCLDRLWLRAGARYVFCAPVDAGRQENEHYRRDFAKKGNAYSRDVSRPVRSVMEHYLGLARGGVAFPEEFLPGDDYAHRLGRLYPWADLPHVDLYDRFEEGHDLEKVSERLLGNLRSWRALQHPLGLDPRCPAFAGHWGSARWLLVGEAPGPRQVRCDGSLAFPFVDRCSTLSASTWLNRALHALDVAEAFLLWTNVSRENGAKAPFSRELIALANDDRTRNLPAIALGRVAEDALRRLGFRDVRPVAHPQSARRFRHRDDYAKELEKVLR